MKKIFGFVFCFLLIISNCFLIVGCGCNDGGHFSETEDILLEYFDETLPSGIIEFTYSILNFTDFDRITPLGQVNPRGHTFPTDHIYFVTNGLEKPVFAPSGGKILHIEEPGDYGDRAIRIAVTSTMTYYLGHIFVDETLKQGDTIVAGTQIGTIGNTSCVDFGVLNKNINNGFLSEKLPPTTTYGDKPLSYYAEPLTHSTILIGKTIATQRRT